MKPRSNWMIGRSYDGEIVNLTYSLSLSGLGLFKCRGFGLAFLQVPKA